MQSPYRARNQSVNQNKIYIAPYVHADSEALGGWITWGRRVGIDKLKGSKLLASTTSAGRLFHRSGAATENARLASRVHVLGTIRRGVLESLWVRDETWSFSSEFRYGGDDIRRALNVRVATLWLMRSRIGSHYRESWHWFCWRFWKHRESAHLRRTSYSVLSKVTFRVEIISGSQYLRTGTFGVRIKPRPSYYSWNKFNMTVLTLNFDLDLSKVYSDIWYKDCCAENWNFRLCCNLNNFPLTSLKIL